MLNVEIDPQGALEIASRSRGTPRLANRLLKRVRDFAQVKYDGKITAEIAVFALDLLEVDRYGLDQTDRLILNTMIEKFTGGRWAWIRWLQRLGRTRAPSRTYTSLTLSNGALSTGPPGEESSQNWDTAISELCRADEIWV